MATEPYAAVIGLEVHVQLATASKMFCRCPNRFGAEPNTLVCSVCLGYPGALPVVNGRAVELAARLALALGCAVRERSVFARKSYFYPDLPKGYQITQYEEPLAEGGELPLARHGKAVGLERLHLEEDAGKLLHRAPGGGPLEGESLVDFNRCGVPLVEIVSRPEMGAAEEAQDFLRALHQLLLYTGASDGNMEEGGLRCDANISLRRRDGAPGTRTEIKNLNSFRNLGRALEHEIARQGEELARGGEVKAETRGFDAATGRTHPLRGKEGTADYRYFPEPDLPPLVVSRERREALAATLPEPPWTRRQRFMVEYGLKAEEARALTATPELAAYFEAAAGACPADPRAVAGWARTEVPGRLRERGQEVAEAPPPERLGELVALVEAGEISRLAAKDVLAQIWDSGEPPAAAARRLGLIQVGDAEVIDAWVGEALAAHAPQAREYRAGKEKLLGFFIGRVMERSGGRADPRRVRERLRRALERER